MRVLLVSGLVVLSLLFLVPVSRAQGLDVDALRKELQQLRDEVKGLKDELKVVKEQKQAVAAAPASAAAQGTVTRDELAGVRGEVETLRDDWKRSFERNTAQASRALSLSGLVQTRFSSKDDGANNTNGFSIPLLQLGFSGSLKKDYEDGKNLDYLVSLYSNTTADSYRVAPQDVFINYNVLSTLDAESPRLSITTGQQKKPFGRDPQTTEEYKPTISLAQFDSNLGLSARDIGVVVKGDLLPINDYGYNYRVPLLEYSLGVLNGAGQNVADNNKSKDYVGRLVLNAPVDYNSVFRGLSIGGSVYEGQQPRTATLSGVSVIRGQGAKERIGADIGYVRTPVGFTAEYAQGYDEILGGTSAAPTERSIRSHGYAGTVFYNFGQQFLKASRTQSRYDDWFPRTYQPFIRYDHWDPNTNISNDASDVYTLGFNWFFAQTTKLQLNYNIKQTRSAANAPDSNELLAQFQYGF